MLNKMGLAVQIADQFKKYKTDVALKNLAYNFLTRERKRTYGHENENKTIYVIRSLDDTSRLYIGPRHNLLANYFYVLSHVAYAETRGWIPVVDQLNYPIYNSLPYEVHGTKNAWEYFWTQPGPCTLEEAYKSKNVVLSKRNWYGQWDLGYDVEKYYDKDTISWFHGLAQKAALRPEIEDRRREIRQQLFTHGMRILGVSVRMGGHAMNAYMPAPGHPIQPGYAEMLVVCKEKFEEWGMDHLFLATDSDSAISAFRDSFGDKLIVLPRQRCPAEMDGQSDSVNPMFSKQNIYQTSLDYLTEMELLASCTGLIGTVSSGLRYAMVRNGGAYEHIDILDCGKIEDTRMRRGEN